MHALTGKQLMTVCKMHGVYYCKYIHHTSKAKHAWLQGLDAHTYLKDAIIGLTGLEAQRQNSTVFGEGGIARLQGSIGIWESVGAHTEVISMRAKLVELEQNAALEMSRDYGVILAGLYKWIEDKHPKDALAMWSAAAGACGSRTASPA